jgi:outer membrane receptor protein involved in Fe transport
MRRAAIALAALAVLTSSALTQGRDTAAADTSHADSTKVHRLAPVITSTRLGEADERVPSQVDRVNVKDLAPGSAPAAAALLALPGVSAFDDQGTPAQPTLEIRGFNLSPVVGVPQGVSVFLDGVRVNEPDAQELNFDLLPMDAVNRAQLIRGPATLYGKNTLAGALVLFTERGSDIPELSGELSAGSFGAYDANVTAGGTRGGYDGFVTASALNATGWRDDTGIRERSLFMNLGHKTDSTDIALTVLYAHDRILEAGSLPASWLAVNPKLNFTGGDFFEPELWHLSLRGERPLGEGRLRGALFWRHNDIQQFNVNVDAPSSDAFVTNASFGLTGEWSAPLTWWSRPVAFTVGAELARNDVHESIYAELTADTSVHIPPECAANGLCADIKVPETDAGAFAQAVMSLTPKLSLTAAARFDWVRLPFEDLYDSTNSATSTYTHLSPRIGATLAVSPTVRGYASIGGGFRAPAPVELGCASPDAPCPLPYALGDDPALAPVTLTSYEIGADWEPHGGSTLEAAIFRSDVTDEIVFVASNANAGYFENIPRTRRQGVEISGTLALPLGMRAGASYTYIDATYQSTVFLSSPLPVPDSARPGDTFPLSPKNRVTLSFGATRVIGDGALDAEIAMNAVSTQFLRGDDANAEAPLPGYAVWRMRVSYQRPHIGVTANVTNLFDHVFSTFGTYGLNPVGPPGGPPSSMVERFYTPAAPRAVTVAVTVSR